MVRNTSVEGDRVLPGLKPIWHSTYQIPRDGVTYTISSLETHPVAARGTIVCVHGNPTWSYLWRHLLSELEDQWRVIAIDQLGMGYSDRVDTRRSLEQRVTDLEEIIAQIDAPGPITLIAHDWGGPVAMGWAAKHPQRVERMVFFNTGVQIPTTGVPGLIRIANSPKLRNLICTVTATFLYATMRTTRGLEKGIRRAYLSPYQGRHRRRSIAGFVGDIPTSAQHPCHSTLTAIGTAMKQLKVPTLLIWGVRDFVFHTGALADMQKTFPHAQTVTIDTGHLSPEYAGISHTVKRWLENVVPTRTPHLSTESPNHLAQLQRRSASTPNQIAVFNARTSSATSWAELENMIAKCRQGLRNSQAQMGDRVAILAPFQVETIAFIYACWSQGVVPVVTDPGLGIANMRRAIRESHVRFALTTRSTRVTAKLAHLAHRSQNLGLEKICKTPVSQASLDNPALAGDEAAILYTSGATGPSKGVRYTHAELSALTEIIRQTFDINDTDGIVAAYLPFALYAPAWGVPVALPKIKPVKPAHLTSDQLSQALRGINGTLVFAAPVPLRNVIKTSTTTFPSVRCVLCAGAPVSDTLLEQVAKVFPNARTLSPYGMTEMLIITDGDRSGQTVQNTGVCVGNTVVGSDVRVIALGKDPSDLSAMVQAGITGEILVTAPWLFDCYDQQWIRNQESRLIKDAVHWHRTGDVGHIDANNGRLFIEGRLAHVLYTSNGPIAPVPLEQAVELELPGTMVAVVGNGEYGQQKIVVVIEGPQDGAVPTSIVRAIQRVVPNVSSVLYKKELPVDRRHNSKIDRNAIAVWATKFIEQT